MRRYDIGSFAPLAVLNGRQGMIHRVVFSPDGTRLVSGSGDFTVRIWDSLSSRERTRREVLKSGE